MATASKKKGMQDRWKNVKEKLFQIITSPYRFFKAVCFTLGLFTFTFLLVLSLFLFNFFSSLPDFDVLKFKDLQKMAHARVKDKLENKKNFSSWVDIKKIDRDLLFAIVMSEDGTFFQHSGVNYTAMVDSLAENLKKREYATGASTITQQVVKNLFLRNEKSLIRKLKEILIARDLEKHFDKNEILELYLNIAEFGPDLFGVNAASKRFFGKPPAKINAAEGAFMALMLPSPRRYYYAIFQNRYLSKSKKSKIRRILRDMRYKEFISPKMYRKYIRYKYFNSKRGLARE